MQIFLSLKCFSAFSQYNLFHFIAQITRSNGTFQDFINQTFKIISCVRPTFFLCVDVFYEDKFLFSPEIWLFCTQKTNNYIFQKVF